MLRLKKGHTGDNMPSWFQYSIELMNNFLWVFNMLKDSKTQDRVKGVVLPRDLVNRGVYVDVLA